MEAFYLKNLFNNLLNDEAGISEDAYGNLLELLKEYALEDPSKWHELYVTVAKRADFRTGRVYFKAA